MNPVMFQLPDTGQNGKIAFDHVHNMCRVHDIVNMAVSVNARELKGAASERALAQKLRELLGGVSWLKGWQVEIDPAEYRTDCDIKATLPLPSGGEAVLRVICKSNPRSHQIAYDRTQNFPSSQNKRQKLVWVLAAVWKGRSQEKDVASAVEILRKNHV